MWLDIFKSHRNSSIEDDALKIRQESERAAQAINTRLSTLTPGETLFVPLGENHAMPAHIVFQMCLFDNLRQSGLKFGVALEYPSNWVTTCSLNQLHEDPQTRNLAVADAQRIIDAQLAADPVTHTLLYAAAFLSPSPYAPHSNATLMNYLKKYQIPIAFVDAAADESHCLDGSDIETKRAIEEAESATGLTTHSKVTFSRDDRLGMAARNIHMQRLSMRFAVRLETASVVFILTGNTHVFGVS
jgi:hypothetical protein